MSEPFDYDVFLSHSAKDKPVVRPLAERLRQDGPMPKAEVPIHPSSLILHPFPSWAQLESGTFRFRDPLNKERRVLPLRLKDAPHQRLPGAIPFHQLAPGGARAGV